MAGIVATSATTNNSGDTDPDKAVDGYLAREEVTLTTDPTGSSYSWTISAPSGSSRSRLSDTDGGAVRFTPDVDGFYVITCNVDGTLYILRLSAVEVGTVATIGPTRYQPLLNAQAPAPSSGRTFFYSEESGAMATKDPSGTVELFTGSSSSPITVDFAPQDPAPSHLRGRVFYDGDNETLAVYNDESDVTHQLGQEVHLRALNKTGSTIPDGTAVYVDGAQGNRPTLDLADASSGITGRAIGVTTAAIDNNQEGIVTLIGSVDYDTSGFSDGDPLWVSSTPGALTNVPPSGTSVAWFMGIALNSTQNGRIMVQPFSPANLQSLHDVDDATPTAGSYLTADGTHWTRADFATGIRSSTKRLYTELTSMPTSNGADFMFATPSRNDGYGFTTTAITVPAPGDYKIYFSAEFSNSNATTESPTGFTVQLGGVDVFSRSPSRPGTSTSSSVCSSGEAIVTIAGESIHIIATGTSGDTITPVNTSLTIEGPL